MYEVSKGDSHLKKKKKRKSGGFFFFFSLIALWADLFSILMGQLASSNFLCKMYFIVFK